MRDDDKLVRQLSLIAYLMAQQRPVTADEIHEAVEGYGGMSEQAFLRRFYADRSEIESKGITLSVERPSDDPFQGDLYALPPENYYLPALDFDQEELSALQTCLYLLEGQFAYAEPLRLALQHLTLGRPSPLDDHAARTVSVNLLGGDYSPDVAASLTKIESAISRRKTIRFTYYSIGRDELSEREVDPYSLMYSGGSWYMVGHSHERGDIRLFRLSRIQGRVTFKTRAEHDFPAPPELDLSRYRDRAQWQLDDPVGQATISLSPLIAWWVEQMFGVYGDVETSADGSAVFTTSYASLDQLVTWVLGLGAEAEVLDPEEVRDTLIDGLLLACERHGSDGVGHSGPGGGPLAVERVPVRQVPVAEPPPAAADPGALPAPEKVVPADRFTRLLALMTILLAACGESAEAHVPLADLRSELNVTNQVIEEDLNLLNLINFGGGCYALYAQIEDGAVLVQRDAYGDGFSRPARLSPLEAKALAWAIEFVRDRLPIGAAQALRSAEQKIQAAIGEQRPTVELNRTQVANEDVVDALNRAIREDRVLEIQYWTESRGTITTRRIEPHLLANARDAWYVDAYCRRAEGRRTFRLDRIRSATLTDEHFERRTGVANPGPYLPFGERVEGGTVAQTASVWCSPRLARWMIEEHRSHERYSDGSALVEIPYASEEWLVKEILKHRGEAVLFEPVALRRTVAEHAERVLDRYGVQPSSPRTSRAHAG